MKRYLVALSLAVLIACEYQQDKPLAAGDGSPDGETRGVTLTPTFSSLHQAIFVPKCLRCHGDRAAGGVRLATHATTMASVGDSGPAVLAGDPEHSPLYLTTKSGEMPRRAPRLSDEEVEAIHAWIRAGALDN